jgi:integrase
MATYKVRGTSHCIIYWYSTSEGEKKQHWETYVTELEAVQRKALIDYLQKNKCHDELRKTAEEYKEKRALEKAALESVIAEAEKSSEIPAIIANDDNTSKTYREFVEKWLPFQARKKRFSPNTYDSYLGNLRKHILPYFGDRVMSSITSEDVDNFLDHLSQKQCSGSKGYRLEPQDVPTLSSATVKKCYNVLTSGFRVAKKWHYINDIPNTAAPMEKNKKRNAWEPQRVLQLLSGIVEDRLIHLAIHIAFVCSLRAGETVGIDLNTIDFGDRSLWITQEVQRVSDKSLEVIPKSEIIRIFPKQIGTSKSSMILKLPKTEGSRRKQYLTSPLLKEINERLKEIDREKDFFGGEYKDYGLLICRPDGRPIDPSELDKLFKNAQNKMHIRDQIEFQGLRKSGQMHKVRLTKNNYQLVAENGGQSPEVLMSNYNEALDSEKRALSLLVETSFYPQATADGNPPDKEKNAGYETILREIGGNPELARQLLQTLMLQAVSVPQSREF